MLAAAAQRKGWSAEDLLRREIQRRERAWRKQQSSQIERAENSALDKTTNSTKLRPNSYDRSALHKTGRLLVEYSTALKKGDRVLLDMIDVPDEFTIELIRAARAVGGHSPCRSAAHPVEPRIVPRDHRRARRASCAISKCSA